MQLEPHCAQKKSESQVEIYDWMLEVCCILKAPKQVFYHAALILHDTRKKDLKLTYFETNERYAAAALILALKFDNSRINYLQAIYHIIGKRWTREELLDAQTLLFKTMNWKLPQCLRLEEIAHRIFQMLTEYVKQNMQSIIKKSQPSAAMEIFKSMFSIQKHQQLGHFRIGYQYVIDLLLVNFIGHLEDRQLELVCVIALLLIFSFHLNGLKYFNPFLGDVFAGFCFNSLRWYEPACRKVTQLAFQYSSKLNLQWVLSNVPLKFTQNIPDYPCYYPVHVCRFK